MTTKSPYTYWVCVDCYFTYHGIEDDEHKPDREPLSAIPNDVEVTSGLLRDEHHTTCRNVVDVDTGEWLGYEDCECDQVTFTWSRCDGCDSRLGGQRFALTVWEA